MPVAEFTESELVEWGEQFGRAVELPAFISLEGDLGAGKTTLVKAIARAQGTLEHVTSPTYGLVHEYHSPRGKVYHLDLYRLTDPEQLHQLGWEDIVELGDLVLVEWPERAGAALPDRAVRLRLEHIDGHPDLRRLSW